MKPMAKFSMEDALADFAQGGRVYIARQPKISYSRLYVITRRPIAWALLFDGGIIRRNAYIVNGQKLIRQIATALLGTGKAKGETRAKLELLLAYCDAKGDAKTEISELFADLRRNSPRPIQE